MTSVTSPDSGTEPGRDGGPGTTSVTRTRGYGGVLGNRRFLVYEASAIAASTGYAVYSISIPWIAYLNSGSYLVVGFVLFLEFGVYTLTFLVAPLVDRAADKRWIFVIGYPIQAVAAGILAYSASVGHLSLPLLFALVTVLAVAWDFEWAVFQVAPRMLLAKDDLFAGQGLASALGSGVQVGGYAAGAGLILLSGAVGSGYLYAGLLILATGLAALVPLRGSGEAETEYRAGLVSGWQYLRSTEGRPLIQLGVIGAISGFFSAAPAVLITLDAKDLFVDPGLTYGLLFTSFVAGGVAVDLLLGHYNPRHRVGVVIISSLVVSAAAVYLTAVFPPSLPLTALAWAAVGAAMAGYLSGSSTFLWGYVPAHQLARVTSNLYLFRGSAASVGVVVAGVLATSLDPGALAGIVALSFAAAAVGALVLPAVRRFAY